VIFESVGLVKELMEKARTSTGLRVTVERISEAQGISYTSGWSARLILFRMQDRASETNLLARTAVEDDLAAAVRDLSDPRDGPIEWLLVQRAAICVIDARQADFEHIWAIQQLDSPWDAEVYDRRRDRAQRRLLQVLRALAEVRRINRPAMRLNQVSIGDGNTNAISV
jgi:hypothetical protein